MLLCVCIVLCLLLSWQYLTVLSSDLLMTGAICGITSGVISYIFGCHRTKKKNELERKELLRYIKLQNNLYDVAEERWKDEYDALYTAYLDMKKETEERDYGTLTLSFSHSSCYLSWWRCR